MIQFDKATFCYPGHQRPALDNLDLHIDAGERVCIMGANGSGKSTLARIIAGLAKLTVGSLKLNHFSDHRLPVGMLFQNPDNQMVAVTVEKELAFALENLGVSQDRMEAEITRTLDRFHISHLRRRLTSELSGGEKQRVALASVMIFQPPILVLDEPDSFLDQPGREALEQELAEVRRANPELVEVRITQYPAVARLYRRLVLLDGGRVAADGDPREILSDRSLRLRTGLCYELDAERELHLPPPGNGKINSDFALSKIVVDGVSFGYQRDNKVLENLNFRFDSGEIIGLVGPSGSGKSTLGLLLCGLLDPVAGSVGYRTGGDSTLIKSDIHGQVAALLQQPERQFFLPTCTEEIEFGPGNLGRPLTLDDTAAFFGTAGLDVERFSKRDPFTLSGGEKRRLAFAAVLSMSPRFVIFDEPTCGLDQEGVGRFIDMARRLKNSGVGLMIISHEGDLIRTLADRILYLNGQKGAVEVPAADFFENPEYAAVLSPISHN